MLLAKTCEATSDERTCYTLARLAWRSHIRIGLPKDWLVSAHSDGATEQQRRTHHSAVAIRFQRGGTVVSPRSIGV